MKKPKRLNFSPKFRLEAAQLQLKHMRCFQFVKEQVSQVWLCMIAEAPDLMQPLLLLGQVGAPEEL